MKRKHPKVNDGIQPCRNQDMVNAVVPQDNSLFPNFGARNSFLLKTPNRGIDFIFEPAEGTFRVCCRFSTFRATDDAIAGFLVSALLPEGSAELLFQVGDNFFLNGALYVVGESIGNEFRLYSMSF